MTGTDDGEAPVRRRRHRRVDAAPTRPDADVSEDLPVSSPETGGGAGARPEAPAGRVGRPAVDRSGDRGGADAARDAWIAAQRPPHWD
ncbi:hypothetical protein ACQE98_02335 [Ornithinimicrobium sp. W1679]|uniref:hypothetical protein n=1 Tax=unclassified Ornithinimicrobium TaxID=2615080 RepID=UPI003CFB5829